MQLNDFFLNVYCPLRLVGRSERTKVLYRYTISRFETWLGRKAWLNDFNDLDVSKFLAWMLDRGYARHTIAKERSQLIALWNCAARKRLVAEFPEVRPIKTPEVVPVAWTREELWRLKISCNCQHGSYNGVPANKWWLAIHAVIYATGERIGAVMQARFSDLRDGAIIFPAENRKGSSKAITASLPPYALEHVRAIEKPERDLIFPWPYSSGYLYIVYKRILERAELDHGHRSKFHRLRRTHATLLTVAGGNASQSLGHSNPETTAKYIDTSQLPDQRQLLPPF